MRNRVYAGIQRKQLEQHHVPKQEHDKHGLRLLNPVPRRGRKPVDLFGFSRLCHAGRYTPCLYCRQGAV